MLSVHFVPLTVTEDGLGGTMDHTVREKTKLLGRIRRIRGQAEAVERALENGIGCADALHLVVSIRGTVNGLVAELLEKHIRLHVVDPACESEPARAKGAEELIRGMRTYMK